LGFRGGCAGLGLDQCAGFFGCGGAIAQLFRQAAMEPGIGLGMLPHGEAEGIGDFTHSRRLLWLDPGAAVVDERFGIWREIRGWGQEGHARQPIDFQLANAAAISADVA
jgi:hypothetical protein